MAGTRRKRSPEKDDGSKRRRTEERQNPPEETTPQEPSAGIRRKRSPEKRARSGQPEIPPEETAPQEPSTTDPEQNGTEGHEETTELDKIEVYLQKWVRLAPSKFLATSSLETAGDPEDLRPPTKSVRFAKGTEHEREDSGDRDQDHIDDQLLRENGVDNESPTEPTPTDEDTPEEGFGDITASLPRTRLPQGDFKAHPVLPRTDDEFEEALVLIKRTAWRWAFQHFNNVQTNEARKLDLFKLSQQSPELMEYANWIALGGDSWEEIFNQKRSSLVFGILGKMLEIHVFGHEMFGATPGQLEALVATEKEMVHVDGFVRQQVRASTIRALMAASRVPPHFDARAQSITLSFYTMIRPLIPGPPTSTSQPASPLLPPIPFSKPSTTPTTGRRFSLSAIAPRLTFPPEHTELLATLYQIISVAGKTSLNMRREPATIYHISSPAKNSPFALETSPISSFTATSEEMHCLNLKHLRRAYDFVDDSARALVTMVCFPGIVAYRPGNGREDGEDDGYRTRRVCTAEVVVGWANRAQPIRRKIGDQPMGVGTMVRNWTWGPGDWDISLREAVETRRKSRGISTPLLVAGGVAGAGIAAVAGYMQAQAMNII